MTTETALIPAGAVHDDAIVKIVLDGLTSENSPARLRARPDRLPGLGMSRSADPD